jgi:hypothetical protein
VTMKIDVRPRGVVECYRHFGGKFSSIQDYTVSTNKIIFYIPSVILGSMGNFLVFAIHTTRFIAI